MRFVTTILAATFLAASSSFSFSQEKPTIGLTYIVEHPAIDAVREGIIEGLARAGYKDGESATVIIRSAQGNMATQAQIANEFFGLDLDVALAISTPSAQALKNALKDKPLLFAAVTDPVSAGLIALMEEPGGNVTGTSDKQSFEPTLDLIRKMLPDAKGIGVIFNPGEANSASQVDALKNAVTPYGLEIVEAPAAQTTLVGDAARSLVGRVDAILLPTDSTVVSVVESIVTVGKRAGLPVFASDTGSVERGALAALGFNYFDMGEMTAQMAVRVLNGEKPGDIPAAVPASQDLYLNLESAEAMGVSVDDDLRSSAKKVID